MSPPCAAKEGCPSGLAMGGVVEGWLDRHCEERSNLCLKFYQLTDNKDSNFLF
jgi:hypothetical protein